MSIIWGVHSAFPGVWPWFLGPVLVSAAEFRAHATSWWRSEDENRAVGGDPDSQHLFGLGVDLVPTAGTPEALAARLRSFGLIAVPTSTHVHVQAFPAGTLRSFGFFT